MSDSEGPVVGIDLGTTFSEIAAFRQGKVEVISWEGEATLPSVVGLSPAGELVVGTPARNQYAAFPDRTVRSIKRRMGENVTVTIGDRTFRPQEISALILLELVRRAQAVLGQPIRRAVITIPAFFSDAQRQATREAGEIAGLEVLRIFHEPTAAALAYEEQDAHDRTLAVYDLGGGTFDCSIVRVQGDVTEVLASHGDTHLGGDDFDELLADHLLDSLREKARADLTLTESARRRLMDVAEQAKRRLSAEPFVHVREEHLAERDGVPVHLDVEVSRERYEELIRPLLERTLDSLHRALSDAELTPQRLEGILLVGGSTRTPLVAQMLQHATGLVPEHRVHPDLCVALGAGVLAARLGGEQVARVLVDVTPYSFGPSVFGDLDGEPYPECFSPVIPRNTPLPASRTEVYQTMVEDQKAWDVRIYQGEELDALRNILIGRFKAEGFAKAPAGNLILCRLDLDLDGLLHVTVIEKRTGLTKKVTIERALDQTPPADLSAARERLVGLLPAGDADRGAAVAPTPPAAAAGEGTATPAATGNGAAPANSPVPRADSRTALAGVRDGCAAAGASSAAHEPQALVERACTAAARMHPEDREDALRLVAQIRTGQDAGDEPAVRKAAAELADLLLYVGDR